MEEKEMRNLLALLLLMFLFFVSIQAQENLLKNPSAELDEKSWKFYGDAKIEEFDGNKRFVIRNGGYFLQEIMLPEQSTGNTKKRNRKRWFSRTFR